MQKYLTHRVGEFSFFKMREKVNFLTLKWETDTFETQNYAVLHLRPRITQSYRRCVRHTRMLMSISIVCTRVRNRIPQVNNSLVKHACLLTFCPKS